MALQLRANDAPKSMLNIYYGVCNKPSKPGLNHTNKDSFNWISIIRLPDFVTKAEFYWASSEASKKKKLLKLLPNGT